MNDKAEQPTKFEFEVNRVANGLILRPISRGGYATDYRTVFVFTTMTDLAAWLLAEEAKR